MLPVGVRPARKRRPVEPRRIVEVEVERYAVQVLGGAQALSHSFGLLLPMVRLGLRVGAGVESGAVETKSHIPKIRPALFPSGLANPKTAGPRIAGRPF
jgi:hypothetical protein